jgi:hypothetical protein
MNFGVVRGLLTLVCASALLMVAPGSALAGTGLAITTSTDFGVAVSGPGPGSGCTFVANSTSADVNVSEVDACLQDGDSVSITDPSGDAGSIEVDSAIAPSSCNASGLTLDEEGGPVELDSGIDLGACDVVLEADGGSIAQTAGGAVSTTAELSVDSISGGVTLNGANNAVSELSGSSTGALQFFDESSTLELETLTSESAGITISGSGALVVENDLSAEGTATLTAENGALTETGSGAIAARLLDTSSIGDTTLTSSTNDIAGFEAGTTLGFLELDDEDAVNLDGISQADGFSITDATDINLVGSLNGGSGNDATLVSNGGTVSGDGAVYAGDLTVDGTAVSLPASNSVAGTFNATATDGDVSANFFYRPTSLGAISASGSVTLSNGAGTLQPTGAITGQSIALTAAGFTAASGNSASLAAPNVSVTDTDASDAWAVTPSTIAAQGAGTIAYSGASNLAIDGGESFDVTPSASTTMTLNGGEAATLTYDAQGRTVSGTNTAPSGEIDSPSVDPVNFSGMTAVDIQDAATSGGGGSGGGGSTDGGGGLGSSGSADGGGGLGSSGSADGGGGSGSGGSTGGSGGSGSGGSTGGGSNGGGTTTTSSRLPTCTLRASSSTVALPKRVHGKLKGKATLTLVATCNRAVHVMLSAGITVVSKPAHRKTKTKYYRIAEGRASIAADAPMKIILDVPSGAVSALSTKGDKLPAMFTLADTDNRNSVLTTIRLPRLT